MTPENKTTMMWTAVVIVGLVILAAILLFSTGIVDIGTTDTG